MESNARADALAMTITIPQKLGQTKLSHDFYHKNAQTLAKQFDLILPQTRDVVNNLLTMSMDSFFDTNIKYKLMKI